MTDTSKLKMPKYPNLWHASLEEVEDGRIVRLHGDEVRKCQWTLRGADHWVVMESDGGLRIDWDGADARLAAAAPDLLTEVKRLREILENREVKKALNPNYRALWWSIDDMRPLDEEHSHWCCDECARGLLDTVMRRADASIGISWNVIQVHREMTDKDCDDEGCCFFKGVDA